MNRTTEPAEPSRGILAPASLLHWGFVLCGVTTTMLGPLLPLLAERFQLSDSRAGLIFPVQFLGSTTGSLLSSILLVRLGYRDLLALSYVLMCFAPALLLTDSWTLCLAGVALSGAGLGFCIAASNLFVASRNSSRRAAALSILNFTWGAGAIACPSLLALAQHAHSLHWFLVILAALQLCVALGFVLHPERDFPTLAAPHHTANGIRFNWWSSAAPWVGAMLFLYVGVEVATGGWLSAYAKRRAHMPGELWMLMPSFFWGALVLGRAMAPLVLRRVSESTLLRAAVALAAAGGTVLLVLDGSAGILAGTVLAGLGLAPVFPLLIALISHRLGPAAERWAGGIFALGGLGGGTLPWLVGFVSSRTGELKAGLMVPLVGAVVLLAVHLMLPAEREPQPQESERPA